MTPIAKETTEKNRTSSNLKPFAIQRTLSRKEKDRMGENICKSIFDNGLVFRLYKELLQFNKTNIPIQP